MNIKDMLGITVGSALAGQTISSIAQNMPNGIGRATQAIVGVGFLGHVAGKAKDSFKFFK